MRKRITSLLLTLVMLLSLVPAMGVTASAADDRSYTQAEIRDYATFASYLRSFDSRDLKLMEDINYTVGIKDVPINVIRNQKLDLNGHKITIDASRRTGFVHLLSIRRGEFTLYDSVGGGELAVAFPDDNKAYSIIMMSSENEDEPSKFTMNGGTLTKLRPNMTYTYGASGCIGDDYFNKPENGKRSQITINGGTINCAYDWDRSKSLLSLPVEAMPLALQLLYSNLTINGGTFNGIVWTDELWRREQDTDPRVVLNGGVFNSPFVVEGMQKDATQIVIDGAHFKDGFHVDKVGRYRIMDVGTVPVLLLKSGVFDSPDKNPKLDIYNVTANSYGNGVNSDATARARLEMILHAMKCFPNSAIKVNGKFYTSENIESLVGKNIDDFYLKLNSSTPIEVIRDAWGVMKSVTLDGNPINYFKDWKGTVERMDNSTAHTLKFEWYPLASELVNAGYTYRTTCEHYISGSTAVQHTDTIAADKTSHTVTIEKGVDPKVYSYDLQLNLQKDGSSVGIISNEHIVKLVVSEAPVVEPDPTIDGTVYYTSGIVFGHPISIAASVTPAEATKSYQWQRSTDGGSTWTNIEGATSGRYTPVTADMGENVRIRVKVTAEGYLGEIVGAAVKVSKAANNDYPAVIQLEAVKDSEDNYTGFQITNFDSDCEYVYSTTDTPNWSANQISSATVTGLTSNTTYYVFARFKETATHTAGSIVSKNSIMLYDYVPLQYVLLEGYDSGEKIYIKKGESVTLKVSADPINANSWSEITFKERGTATGCITVTDAQINANTGTATPFPNDHTITINGNSVGNATLDASYSGSGESYYGWWDVVVYDDSTVADALRLENVYAYADITLSENDEAQLPTKLPRLLPENSGYHLEWRILKGGTSGGYMYVTENDNIKLDGNKIKPKAAHAESEKAQLELVAVKDDDNTTIKLLAKTSPFYVTVTKAPTITLTGVTVAPKKVNLANVGATCQLSAVKEPVNAAGSLNWESSNTSVATVDSNGNVTAVAKGEATITVSCNGKSASCTVTVDHTHNTNSQTWALLNDNEHFRSCTAGDDTQIEAHKVNSWTANTDGKTHTGTCTECGYAKTENHSWEVVGEVAPTVDTEGSRSYKCSACAATKTESIPKLIEYSVTVQDDGNGTASASPATAVAGTEIKLTATANSGYHFKEWQVVTGSVTINGNKFTMPDGNVEVKAIFEKNTSTGGGGGGGGVTTYAITVKSAKNGDVTASHKTASKGTAVTLTVDPDKGYVLDTLTVLDGKDKEIKLTEKNGKFTFTMPASKVTVAATFKASAPTGKNPFIDVPAGSYYEDAVVWAVEKGITSGTSAVTFDPNGNCTRAQAVTFLWRAAGSPAPKSMNSFADVPADAYYAKAVAWAVENGITSGTGGGKFSPDATCTRAQIVTFLYRAAGSPAVSGGSVFSDVKAGAYYADAVTWAANKDITGGIGNGLFGSDNNCTRAQIVTFLYRYME